MTLNDMIEILTELQESGHGNEEVSLRDDNYGELCTVDIVWYNSFEGCVIISGC